MTEHDLDVDPVPGGFLVTCRSDPKAPYKSPAGNKPVDSDTGYKFLENYAANINSGDTIRANRMPFSSAAAALAHLKSILYRPAPPRDFTGMGRR